MQTLSSQRGLLLKVLSNDQKIVEETIEKVINFFDSYSEIEIINIKREIL